jgi:hypothetical protein
VTYQYVSGEGLSTGWATAPRINVETAPGNNPTHLDMEFSSAPDGGQSTRLHFRNVYRYEWCDIEAEHFNANPGDVEFALIEILDSQELEKWPGQGGAFGEWGTLRVSNFHHYRIAFDDHGTYDVICTDLHVELVHDPSVKR